jgi:hypothetical protein
VLQELQTKHEEIEAQFRKERAELEAKYEKLYGGLQSRVHHASQMLVPSASPHFDFGT